MILQLNVNESSINKKVMNSYFIYLTFEIQS